jgi:transcriptional regulator GlxA family with amidase domain
VNGKASEVSSEGGESSSSSLPPIIISDLTVLTDGQLFLCLRDLIENERLYLQPDFGRQTLIEHTGLSKERIGAAFAQGSDRNSLPAYVRELRLDYAIRLMNAQPEITVEQVSMASGFTSADTFTRNFRAKYGMTPTVYKQTKNGE